MADTSPDENGSNSAVEQKTKKPSGNIKLVKM